METLMRAQLGRGQAEREIPPPKVLLEQKPCSTSGLHQKIKTPSGSPLAAPERPTGAGLLRAHAPAKAKASHAAEK